MTRFARPTIESFRGSDPCLTLRFPMPPTQTLHLDRYTTDARGLVAGAQALADERQHGDVEPIHFLHRAVDRDRGVAEVFRRAGAEPSDLLAESDAALKRMPKTSGGEAYLAQAFIELLTRAERDADREKAAWATSVCLIILTPTRMPKTRAPSLPTGSQRWFQGTS